MNAPLYRFKICLRPADKTVIRETGTLNIIACDEESALDIAFWLVARDYKGIPRTDWLVESFEFKGELSALDAA